MDKCQRDIQGLSPIRTEPHCGWGPRIGMIAMAIEAGTSLAACIINLVGDSAASAAPARQTIRPILDST